MKNFKIKIEGNIKYEGIVNIAANSFEEAKMALFDNKLIYSNLCMNQNRVSYIENITKISEESANKKAIKFVSVFDDNIVIETNATLNSLGEITDIETTEPREKVNSCTNEFILVDGEKEPIYLRNDDIYVTNSYIISQAKEAIEAFGTDRVEVIYEEDSLYINIHSRHNSYGYKNMSFTGYSFDELAKLCEAHDICFSDYN